MSIVGDVIDRHLQTTDSSGYPACLQEDWETEETTWGDRAMRSHAEHVAEHVLAALSVQPIDLAQRLVLTLGEKRYPIISVQKVGDRITLTAQLEDS